MHLPHGQFGSYSSISILHLFPFLPSKVAKRARRSHGVVAHKEQSRLIFPFKVNPTRHFASGTKQKLASLAPVYPCGSKFATLPRVKEGDGSGGWGGGGGGNNYQISPRHKDKNNKEILR